VADPRQIWSIAADLVRQHGGAAAAVAEHNALRAGAGGDTLWEAVARAARQLLKGAPEPEERVH
jgi:hypothetical protein